MHVGADTLSEYLEADLSKFSSLHVVLGRDHESAKFAAIERLRSSLLKKYLPGTSAGTTRSTDAAALALFIENNELCREFVFKEETFSPSEKMVVAEVRSQLHTFFFPSYDGFILDRSSVYTGLGLGNGSNLGSRSTDFYSKLSTSRLATTNLQLHMLYREAISHHPTWSRLEAFRDHRRGVDLVPGNRLSFVPKTRDISRTICTEPLLNMLFQKGVASCIERRLCEVYGIDLAEQPDKNSELARLGSLSGDFGTIDLSSASDTISMTLCRSILPRQVVTWLERCRSPETVLPDGTRMELHMVSSMGNAFTFPLQTLLFTAVVEACYRVMHRKLSKPRGTRLGNFGVFGDDIIVHRDLYDLVVTMLHRFGFTVNLDKSFNTGLFRESCGTDFWSGHNVRAVYFKRLADESDVYSAINRLVRWEARWGVPLPRLIGFLLTKVRRIYVPFDESDDSGLKVPLSSLSNVRRNKNHSVKYRCLVQKPNRIAVPDSPSTAVPIPDWLYNPDGLVLAAVAGTLRSGYIVVRQLRRHAIVKVRHTPRWDYVPPGRYESSDFGSLWKKVSEERLVTSPEILRWAEL